MPLRRPFDGLPLHSQEDVLVWLTDLALRQAHLQHSQALHQPFYALRLHSQWVVEVLVNRAHLALGRTRLQGLHGDVVAHLDGPLQSALSP